MKVTFLNEGVFGSYKNQTGPRSKEDIRKSLAKSTFDAVKEDLEKNIVPKVIGDLMDFLKANDFAYRNNYSNRPFILNSSRNLIDYKVIMVNRPTVRVYVDTPFMKSNAFLGPGSHWDYISLSDRGSGTYANVILNDVRAINEMMFLDAFFKNLSDKYAKDEYFDIEYKFYCPEFDKINKIEILEKARPQDVVVQPFVQYCGTIEHVDDAVNEYINQSNLTYAEVAKRILTDTYSDETDKPIDMLSKSVSGVLIKDLASSTGYEEIFHNIIPEVGVFVYSIPSFKRIRRVNPFEVIGKLFGDKLYNTMPDDYAIIFAREYDMYSGGSNGFTHTFEELEKIPQDFLSYFGNGAKVRIAKIEKPSAKLRCSPFSDTSSSSEYSHNEKFDYDNKEDYDKYAESIVERYYIKGKENGKPVLWVEVLKYNI